MTNVINTVIDDDNDNDDTRYLTMSEIMPPDKANFAGNIHGGHLMSLLDNVAYTCAVRYARQYAVTLFVDQILFTQPIHVGDLVTFHAAVNYVGSSSMEIGIKVIAEDLYSGEKRKTNSCFFIMVAMDSDHNPVKVPPLTLRNAVERRRFKEAKSRIASNRDYKKTHRELKEALKKDSV